MGEMSQRSLEKRVVVDFDATTPEDLLQFIANMIDALRAVRTAIEGGSPLREPLSTNRRCDLHETRRSVRDLLRACRSAKIISDEPVQNWSCDNMFAVTLPAIFTSVSLGWHFVFPSLSRARSRKSLPIAPANSDLGSTSAKTSVRAPPPVLAGTYCDSSIDQGTTSPPQASPRDPGAKARQKRLELLVASKCQIGLCMSDT